MNTTTKKKTITKDQKRENEITRNMILLHISRAEAEQLYIDDRSNTLTPEQKEYGQKAKENGRHYETSEKVLNKKKTTERKRRSLPDDSIKTEAIEYIVSMIKEDYNDVVITNPTREFSFNINDDKYAVSLTKHSSSDNVSPSRMGSDDEVKRNIMEQLIRVADEKYENVTVINPTREITFIMNNNLYSLILIRHSAKKNSK